MVVGEKMSEIFEGRVEDKQEGSFGARLDAGTRRERQTNGRREEGTADRESKKGPPREEAGKAPRKGVEAVEMAQSGIARGRTSQVSGEHHESETQSVSCP